MEDVVADLQGVLDPLPRHGSIYFLFISFLGFLTILVFRYDIDIGNIIILLFVVWTTPLPERGLIYFLFISFLGVFNNIGFSI